ncbi:M42 family peptidase [bacterium]|nr:MAG: M42 family peptidase [bacterium]
MLDLLKELIFQPGLSGYESPIREFIIKRIEKFAAPKVDPVGNVTAAIGAGTPRILFASHMDEIGMVVSYIEDDGFLRIRKVGMVDDRILIGRTVEIIGEGGKIPGVIGIRPPHLYTSLEDFERLREVPTWDKIFVDIGASSRKEVESLGIKIMSPIIFKKDFIILNQNRCAARGIDDRFGCALLIKLLEEAYKKKLDCEITFAWTVQEEIGAIGGQVLASRGLWDIMFAVDSYSSADVPGIPFHYGPSVLGNGPILRMMDHHSISTPELARWVISLSKKEAISLQTGPTGGYTDGKHFLSQGIPMLMISIPVRYMHSPVEMIDLRDMEGLFQLLLKIVMADKKDLRKIAGVRGRKA